MISPNKPTRVILKRIYKDLNLHSETRPAIIWSDGTGEWFSKGKRHRIGGPAVDHPENNSENNLNQYWIQGRQYNKKQYDDIMIQSNLNKFLDEF